ncbi:MAG: ABC transporter ATP-binding protein [Paracoccaceae bacterium]
MAEIARPRSVEPILTAREVTKEFGSFRAIDHVSLDILPGSITGLIGPNGAGKSTFFDVLTGTTPLTQGQISFRGKNVTGLGPDALYEQGLAHTFQIPRPFKRMSVLENVMLAPKSQLGEALLAPFLFPTRMRKQESELRDRAMEVLDFVTLASVADQAAGNISGGQMKLLELARILMGDPDVILLDEPAAGVNPSLTQVLIERIKDLNRRGKTFVIIEHDMDFVMRHCDPVIALAEGQVVFHGTAQEAQDSPALLDAYLGAQVDG